MALLYFRVKKLTIVTNHQFPELYKAQNKINRQQAGWMNLVGNFGLS